mmetsp:Transcript_44469/g.121214  ORF Transcript_44469/g.121214 Transcript_44469/m.121214 type:complete len:304 (-) Transcript_44469:288-1199(-)
MSAAPWLWRESRSFRSSASAMLTLESSSSFGSTWELSSSERRSCGPERGELAPEPSPGDITAPSPLPNMPITSSSAKDTCSSSTILCRDSLSGSTPRGVCSCDPREPRGLGESRWLPRGLPKDGLDEPRKDRGGILASPTASSPESLGDLLVAILLSASSLTSRPPGPKSSPPKPRPSRLPRSGPSSASDARASRSLASCSSFERCLAYFSDFGSRFGEMGGAIGAEVGNGCSKFGRCPTGESLGESLGDCAAGSDSTLDSAALVGDVTCSRSSPSPTIASDSSSSSISPTASSSPPLSPSRV